MPRTFETTVFQYDELSDAAKAKAREWGAEAAHRYFEPSHLTDWFREELERKCLPFEDIEWSLSYSQGDGVAFYGTVDDLTGLLRHAKALTKFRGLRDARGEWRVDVSLSRNDFGHHYAHWNTMTVNVEWLDDDYTARQSDLMDALHDTVKAYVQATSRELEKAGYSDIEYQSSDEVVVETIRANEYEFDAEGRRA